MKCGVTDRDEKRSRVGCPRRAAPTVGGRRDAAQEAMIKAMLRLAQEMRQESLSIDQKREEPRGSKLYESNQLEQLVGREMDYEIL